MNMKKRILSAVLSMGMAVTHIVIADAAVPSNGAIADSDQEIIVNDNFDDITEVPAEYAASDNGVTLEIRDGKLIYGTNSVPHAKQGLKRSIDLSLKDAYCDNIVFEYDIYPESIGEKGYLYKFPAVDDAEGDLYTNTYLSVSNNSMNITESKTWRYKYIYGYNDVKSTDEETGEDTYYDYNYHFKLNMNLKKKEYSITIDTVDSTGIVIEPGKTTKAAFITENADDVISNLYFLTTENNPGVAIAIDNVKIYKEGVYDENTVIYHNFNDGSVPEEFSYTKAEGYEPKLSNEGGKIKFYSQALKDGGLFYDLSSLGSLKEQKCEKLIFEYEYYPETLDIAKNTRYYYTRITDENGKNYNDFYVQTTTSSQVFYDTTSATKMNMASWNFSDEDEDKYYKIKMTLDILNQQQSVQIAEMNVDGTSEAVYKVLALNKPYKQEVDGTLGQLQLYYVPGWDEKTTIYFDNLKVYKEGIIHDMTLSQAAPADGAVLVSQQQEITLTFTNLVGDASGITMASPIETSDAQVEIEKTVVGSKVIIKPVTKLNYGAVYNVTIPQTVTDIYGNSLTEEKKLVYSVREDPTAKEGEIIIKDTFDDLSSLSDYSWTDDATVNISEGFLKFSRPNNVKAQGVLKRNIGLDMSQKLGTTAVIEYDLYPVDLRHNKNSCWQYDFPSVNDRGGNKFCSFYFESIEEKMIGKYVTRGITGTLTDDFNFGPDYMYHIKIAVDFKNGLYKTDLEKVNIVGDGYKNTEWISTGLQKFFEETTSFIDNITFVSANEWCDSNIKVDNLVVYIPDKEFSAELSTPWNKAVNVDAGSTITLELSDAIADENADAASEYIKLLEENGNVVEAEVRISGKTVTIESVNPLAEMTKYNVELDKGILAYMEGCKLADNDLSFITAGKATDNDVFADKDTINVVYLGGSITDGTGASNGNITSWRAKVGNYLGEKYADKTVNNYNAGAGGTGSTIAYLRLANDVISKDPDIVFVEFAVNDRDSKDMNKTKKYMEGIVRRLYKECDKAPIVIYVYTATQNFLSGVENSIAAHSEVAEYYDIPQIDLNAYMKRYTAEYPDTEWLADGVHPNDNGYQLYTDYIIERLDKAAQYYLKPFAWQDTPLMENGYDFSTYYEKAENGNCSSGWTVSGDTIVSKSAGDTVTYKFSGRLFALKHNISRTNGALEISIDGEDPTVLDTYYNVGGMSSMQYIRDDLENTEHTVKITTKATARGSDIKLYNFIVCGDTTTVDFTENGAVVTVLNNKIDSMTYDNIFARYSTDSLISAESNKGTVAKGKCVTYNYNFNDGEKVRVFTWDSVLNMKPLNNVIEK